LVIIPTAFICLIILMFVSSLLIGNRSFIGVVFVLSFTIFPIMVTAALVLSFINVLRGKIRWARTVSKAILLIPQGVFILFWAVSSMSDIGSYKFDFLNTLTYLFMLIPFVVGAILVINVSKKSSASLKVGMILIQSFMYLLLMLGLIFAFGLAS